MVTCLKYLKSLFLLNLKAKTNMNTKEILAEWKNFLSEAVDPAIYFKQKGLDLEALMSEYNIAHSDHRIYKNENSKIISSPYEKAHRSPGSKLKRMVVGIEFTSKVAIHEQTYQDGQVYVLKNYKPGITPELEHLVPIYDGDRHKAPGSK